MVSVWALPSLSRPVNVIWVVPVIAVTAVDIFRALASVTNRLLMQNRS
jgi:hypothetical protein